MTDFEDYKMPVDTLDRLTTDMVFLHYVGTKYNLDAHKDEYSVGDVFTLADTGEVYVCIGNSEFCLIDRVEDVFNDDDDFELITNCINCGAPLPEDADLPDALFFSGMRSCKCKYCNTIQLRYKRKDSSSI